MKTEIFLPNDLFDAADRLAKRLGVSRDELYASAIEEYLRAHRDAAVTEALNRIYEEEDSSLKAGLVTLQSAALNRDDW